MSLLPLIGTGSQQLSRENRGRQQGDRVVDLVPTKQPGSGEKQLLVALVFPAAPDFQEGVLQAPGQKRQAGWRSCAPIRLTHWASIRSRWGPRPGGDARQPVTTCLGVTTGTPSPSAATPAGHQVWKAPCSQTREAENKIGLACLFFYYYQQELIFHPRGSEQVGTQLNQRARVYICPTNNNNNIIVLMLVLHLELEMISDISSDEVKQPGSWGCTFA